MQREYQPVSAETDLINIERFHAYMKTIVDNEPVPPFSVDMTKDIQKFRAGSNEKIAQAVDSTFPTKIWQTKRISWRRRSIREEVINPNVVNLQNHPFPKNPTNLDTYFFRFNLLEPKGVQI